MTEDQLLWVLLGLIILLFFWIGCMAFLLHKKNNQTFDKTLLESKLDLLVKQNSDLIMSFSEKNGDLKEHLSNVLYQQNRKTSEDFIAFSDKIMDSVEKQMDKINQKVDEKLGAGFKETNETFSSVMERLVRIDEAQKQIEKLSTDVISLNDVLSDKKSRGTFGEIQLKQVISSVFGENVPSIYELQKTLSNQTVVDSVLHAPEPMGDICIDSKFPLENYRKMLDKERSDTLREQALKQFKIDVKKHVDMISEKYIIQGETTDQAIMFIPAEAIFAEINARHEDLVMYAQNKRVWFASPTTLMSTLTIVQVILKDVKRSQYSKMIQIELNKLSLEFERYQDRWDKLLKNISTVNKQAIQVSHTTNKITRRFKSISSVDQLKPSDAVVEDQETLEMFDSTEIE
ncbi:MAG: DNA recombination protein RmuC [Acholeplasma sp.]|nr:DNA recombination protein RmuC [Acholeplasma sp.]